MNKNFISCILILLFFIGNAQNVKTPLVTAIKETDIRRDMYELAGDKFRGREAGTLDELKVAMWLADKAKESGMKPAGDNGTFFQFFDIYRHQLMSQSSLKIGNNNLKLWQDFLVAEPVNVSLHSKIIYVGNIDPEAMSKFNVREKVIVVHASDKNIDKKMTLFFRRYPGFVQKKYYNKAIELGAKAIIFITDDISEQSWVEVLPQMTRGIYGVEGLREKITNNIPVLWIKRENIGWIKNNPKISLNLIATTYKYPSVNIIGKIEGTDTVLKNEYVLLSGHHDHDGIRNPIKKDTIYNGADDNASTCVAMLAIARAYKEQLGRRSILFVFHGAEERGLLGSRWHASHPVVAKKKIVAVLNGDMIGRNNNNEAALLGGNAPHKNSEELVRMAEEANNESTKFQYLKDWDSPDHPEYFYFRSDHLPYAKVGIPAVFFTSVLHEHYHTPQDKSENIDFKKLYKMTEWIYRTSWKVANETERPKVIPNFSLEK